VVHDDVAPDVGHADGFAAVQLQQQPGALALQMQGEEAMKERGPDRRKGVSSWFTAPVNDRRRPANERRVGETVHVAPGAIRPGVGEAVPKVERRRDFSGGME
jgi:hypothetical protein